MTLFIQIENGEPVNHPAFEGNLIQAFGSVPTNWEPFVRVEQPKTAIYETLESGQPTYQKINGVWSDVWPIRPMTTEEKIAVQQATINAFNMRDQAENWAAWTLDEEICEMVPPIPRPAPDQEKLSQYIHTFWCGAENNWKDTPPRPQDGKLYKFDFFAWQWVEVVSG